MRDADNHVGWEVQVFIKGEWKPLNHIRDDKSRVFDIKKELEYLLPEFEFRVYEALKEK